VNAPRIFPSTPLGILLAALVLAACREAPPPSHEEIVRAHLGEIIELQGSPCGQVLDYTLDDRFNFRIRCKTGDVYRIHVNAEGHIGVDNRVRQE
jgi:hypothetical protein